jgi:hypothetical protein
MNKYTNEGRMEGRKEGRKGRKEGRTMREGWNKGKKE